MDRGWSRLYVARQAWKPGCNWPSHPDTERQGKPIHSAREMEAMRHSHCEADRRVVLHHRQRMRLGKQSARTGAAAGRPAVGSGPSRVDGPVARRTVSRRNAQDAERRSCSPHPNSGCARHVMACLARTEPVWSDASNRVRYGTAPGATAAPLGPPPHAPARQTSRAGARPATHPGPAPSRPSVASYDRPSAASPYRRTAMTESGSNIKYLSSPQAMALRYSSFENTSPPGVISWNSSACNACAISMSTVTNARSRSRSVERIRSASRLSWMVPSESVLIDFPFGTKTKRDGILHVHAKRITFWALIPRHVGSSAVI
jgi:hypothetical protein